MTAYKRTWGKHSDRSRAWYHSHANEIGARGTTVETYIGLVTSAAFAHFEGARVVWRNRADAVELQISCFDEALGEQFVVAKETARYQIERALYDIAGEDAYHLCRRLEQMVSARRGQPTHRKLTDRSPG